MFIVAYPAVRWNSTNFLILYGDGGEKFCFTGYGVWPDLTDIAQII
jgi:hypothetical protein